MPRNSASALRQIYEEWVEEQIENFKDSVSRSDLLRIADEAVEEIRMSQTGQYQLTEVLLWTAVDRKIFKLLKLPGFRIWSLGNHAAEPVDYPDPVMTM
jgi:hypothetical protein